MPGTTSRLALPYATPDDTVDVPRDIKALTDKLDPLAATFVQGTAATRPAAGVAGRYHYATDSGALSYDTGSAWLGVAGPTPSNIPLVSVLPASPVDGQEVYFQNSAMALDGVMWHLRYRLASASYKWECIGGSPWHTPLINDANTTGAGASWSSTLGDGAGAVGINLPLAGDYFVTWSGWTSVGAAVTTQPAMGVWRPNDGAAPYVSIASTNYGSGAVVNMSGSGRLIGCTVGRANMAYLYTAQITTYGQRRISILPIKVN